MAHRFMNHQGAETTFLPAPPQRTRKPPRCLRVRAGHFLIVIPPAAAIMAVLLLGVGVVFGEAGTSLAGGTPLTPRAALG